MVQVSGRRVSLIDWRGFEAQDTKAISGRGCRFGGGGGCLRGSVAGATRGDGNGSRGGHWTGSRLSGEFVAAEDAVSYGGAGAACDRVVSVPGAHAGARPNTWNGEDGPREDGVEGVRGARQRQIRHQEDRAVERAFPFDEQGVPGGAAGGGGAGGRGDREHCGGRGAQPVCGGRHGAGARYRVQQAMGRCGGGDRFTERAHEYPAGEGFETGLGTDGGELEARGGVRRGEKRGGKPGKRQWGQRRSVFPGESDRKGEQQMAVRAAGFWELPGGLRRGVRLLGNRWDVFQRVQHFACEGNGSG